MLEELDAFDFALAEKLGMTIGEMHERMSNQEFVMWRAFWVYRHEMQQMELDEKKWPTT
jgi:hypothetical protein